MTGVTEVNKVTDVLLTVKYMTGWESIVSSWSEQRYTGGTSLMVKLDLETVPMALAEVVPQEGIRKWPRTLSTFENSHSSWNEFCYSSILIDNFFVSTVNDDGTSAEIKVQVIVEFVWEWIKIVIVFIIDILFATDEKLWSTGQLDWCSTSFRLNKETYVSLGHRSATQGVRRWRKIVFNACRW